MVGIFDFFTNGPVVYVFFFVLLYLFMYVLLFIGVEVRWRGVEPYFIKLAELLSEYKINKPTTTKKD